MRFSLRLAVLGACLATACSGPLPSSSGAPATVSSVDNQIPSLEESLDHRCKGLTPLQCQQDENCRTAPVACLAKSPATFQQMCQRTTGPDCACAFDKVKRPSDTCRKVHDKVSKLLGAAGTPPPAPVR